jgi:DNA-binding MarR family transcriptional regulator
MAAVGRDGCEPRLEFLIRDVARLLRRRFEQSAQGIGLSLTRAQCFVLVHVAREPGLSQARLAQLMDVEPIALVRLIDRLEAETLLERRLDPRDRRIWRVYPTDAAAAALERIQQISDAVTRSALGNVAAQESAALLTVLQRLKANLSMASPGRALETAGGGSLAAPADEASP